MILFFLLTPIFITAQLNPAFVSKSDLGYNRVEYKGDGLFGFESKDKFGYMDKTGKIIIQPDYSYSHNASSIPNFMNGYAVIKQNGMTGLINKKGEVVIPFIYETLRILSSINNYFIATKKEGGKTTYGLITAQNKTAVPFEYEELVIDSNLVGVKKNGLWGLVDLSGKQILNTEYNSLTPNSKYRVLKAEKGAQYGYIDLTGKWLFEKSKNVFTLYSCKLGMIQYKVNNKYGYLDLKGNEVIISKYESTTDFENTGLAKVSQYKSGATYNTVYGFIDRNGKEIIPVKYELMGVFSNGLVWAKDPETNRYGFMDKTGSWVLKPVYLSANGFDESGGAWVKFTDDKHHYINKAGKDLGMLNEKGVFQNFGKDGYGSYEHADYSYVLIDKSGKVLKTLEDCDAIYNFSEGIAGFKSKASNLYGFLDLNGNKIIPPDYTGFTGFADGVSKVSQTINSKTKSGYITNKNEIFLPIKYDTLYGFRDGWGLLKNNGKYFFVDKSGNLKDPPRVYDELIEFRSGFALGKVKGTGDNLHTYYYINTQLKEAFSISAWQAYLFWEDVAVASRDNKTYELLNKKGEIFKTLDGIQTLKFCNDGMLSIKENSKWGFINSNGENIVKATYDSTDSFKYGHGRIRTGTKWGIVDRSGTVIFEPRYENIFPGENGLFIFFDGGWGVLDKTGKILKEPALNTLTTFEKDRALAKLGKTYTIIKSPLAK